MEKNINDGLYVIKLKSSAKKSGSTTEEPTPVTNTRNLAGETVPAGNEVKLGEELQGIVDFYSRGRLVMNNEQMHQKQQYFDLKKQHDLRNILCSPNNHKLVSARNTFLQNRKADVLEHYNLMTQFNHKELKQKLLPMSPRIYEMKHRPAWYQ